jgi:hypothetical protein
MSPYRAHAHAMQASKQLTKELSSRSAQTARRMPLGIFRATTVQTRARGGNSFALPQLVRRTRRFGRKDRRAMAESLLCLPPVQDFRRQNRLIRRMFDESPASMRTVCAKADAKAGG